jgi:hypothetical protein
MNEDMIKANWVKREDGLPTVDRRVLTFSPIYPIGDVMRHRMMDAQFFRICTEATHWLDITEHEPEI